MVKNMNVEQLRLWLRGERDAVYALSTTAADNISAIAEVTGMLAMPLIPAGLTALNMVFAMLLSHNTWPVEAVVAAAVVIVIGLESLGISACKTAMRLYRAWREGHSTKAEFYTATVTVLLYATLVIAINLLGDNLPKTLEWIAYTSPVLAVAMYIVVGFNADLQRAQDARLRQDQAALEYQEAITLAQLEDQTARLQLKRDQDQALFKQKLELKRLEVEAKIAARTQKLTGAPGTSTIVQARNIVAQYPSISGAELGRRLGLTDRQGQNLLAQIKLSKGQDGK